MVHGVPPVGVPGSPGRRPHWAGHGLGQGQGAAWRVPPQHSPPHPATLVPPDVSGCHAAMPLISPNMCISGRVPWVWSGQEEGSRQPWGRDLTPLLSTPRSCAAGCLLICP